MKNNSNLINGVPTKEVIGDKSLWPEVTRSNYFSNEMSRFYMGSTQFKKFIPAFGGCELSAMAELKGIYKPDVPDAFLAGSYGHAWNEGPMALEKFKAEHPEMYSSRGATKGQLKSQFKVIGDCIEAIETDPFMMKALEGDKEKIFVAEMFGMPWKVQLDVYNESRGAFVDLKFLKALDDKKWNVELQLYEHIFEAYGYYLQSALYAEAERLSQERNDHYQPFLAVVTKEKVPDKALISFVSDEESHSDFINQQLAIAAGYADRIRQVKYEGAEPIGCGKCDYCKSIKKLTGTTHYSQFSIY